MSLEMDWVSLDEHMHQYKNNISNMYHAECKTRETQYNEVKWSHARLCCGYP